MVMRSKRETSTMTSRTRVTPRARSAAAACMKSSSRS
jgi:hypothetical protein